MLYGCINKINIKSRREGDPRRPWRRSSRLSLESYRMHAQHFRPLSDVLNVDKKLSTVDWGPMIAAPNTTIL